MSAGRAAELVVIGGDEGKKVGGGEMQRHAGTGFVLYISTLH